MSNTFGTLFRVTTFGESHGPAIGLVIDGVPSRFPLDVTDIQKELDRRRPGQSRLTTQRRESDQAEILSGVFEGETTGAPLAILIRNQDARSKDYEALRHVFRPGHADFTYYKKYGVRDHRGGGRSSGRETACRVAAGAVAKKILHKKWGVRIVAYTKAVGHIQAETIDYNVIEQNPVRAPDPIAAEAMAQLIDAVRKECDSIGGVVEARVHHCPPGWGEPCFDKLNAKLAHALCSIGAVRGVEFGDGFAAAMMKGSQHNDVFIKQEGEITTQTNHCGGILGGLSTGQDIVLRVAIKPPSSIAQPQKTVNINGEAVEIQVKGRHDPCLCPRVVPVVEAMIALVLMDAALLHHAIQL